MTPDEIIDRLADEDPWHHCIGMPELDECRFCGATGPTAIRHRISTGRRRASVPIGVITATHNPDCIWYAARAIRRGVPA